MQKILNRIRKTGRRAAINTMELMIIIVVVAALVGTTTAILNTKINTMSSKMDASITAVTSSLPVS